MFSTLYATFAKDQINSENSKRIWAALATKWPLLVIHVGDLFSAGDLAVLPPNPTMRKRKPSQYALTDSVNMLKQDPLIGYLATTGDTLPHRDAVHCLGTDGLDRSAPDVMRVSRSHISKISLCMNADRIMIPSPLYRFEASPATFDPILHPDGVLRAVSLWNLHSNSRAHWKLVAGLLEFADNVLVVWVLDPAEKVVNLFSNDEIDVAKFEGVSRVDAYLAEGYTGLTYSSCSTISSLISATQRHGHGTRHGLTVVPGVYITCFIPFSLRVKSRFRTVRSEINNFRYTTPRASPTTVWRSWLSSRPYMIPLFWVRSTLRDSSSSSGGGGGSSWRNFSIVFSSVCSIRRKSSRRMYMIKVSTPDSGSKSQCVVIIYVPG